MSSRTPVASSSENENESGPSTLPAIPRPKTKSTTKDDKVKPKSNSKSKPRTKPIPKPISAFKDPSIGEEETVHEIYESIAPHFALTRHKPWPLITSFLQSLPPNSLGLDSGSGNGKYLPTAHAHGHTMIALDRSLGLLEIAQKQIGGEDIVRGDLGGRGWRDGIFDFTISVAAIHHLSTPQRRRQAVQAILPTLQHNSQPPYSKFFIYVWAYEQGELSKREMGSAATANAPKEHEREREHEKALETQGNSPKGTEHTEDIGGRVQDVLVPWVLKSKSSSSSNSKSKSKSKPGSKSETRSDRTSYTNTNDRGIDTQNSQDQNEKEEEEEEGEKVFHRYYHLFIKGELREMIEQAGIEEGYQILPSTSTSTSLSPSASEIPISGLSNLNLNVNEKSNATEQANRKWLRIKGEGWEADNWWVEAEVGMGVGDVVDL